MNLNPILDYLNRLEGDWNIGSVRSPQSPDGEDGRTEALHISRNGMVYYADTSVELHYHPSDNQKVIRTIPAFPNGFIPPSVRRTFSQIYEI